MLLTLTTTHQPATDLGYLLRKNSARPQSFSLTFGKAHVFGSGLADADGSVHVGETGLKPIAGHDDVLKVDFQKGRAF